MPQHSKRYVVDAAMKCKYIFDVDGTLTPSREKIDETFRGWFSDFCDRNAVHLVTGSDYSKTREQLGEALILRPVSVYTCSGNEMWARGERIRSRVWQLPDELRSTLLGWVEASGFERKTGCHIEDRQGAVNFSVVGRNANRSERSAYMVWDAETEERGRMARRINSLHPDLHASVGGETGIDIYPRGYDKSQILADFSVADIIYFFGDRMDTMGNDYPLSSRLKEPSKSFHVTDWRHTFKTLEELGA
jgi:phosphomannomutase